AYTLSRGRVVWADGQLRTERGYGKYIDRPCFPSYWQSQRLRNERAAAEPRRLKIDRRFTGETIDHGTQFPRHRV
ncbi:MAG: hypothetical protein Q8S73_10840, partial [Deltaproteobacteria bacterium]|nr:hypothetical protein [Deltaproteobacteria bacterium]